MPLINQIFGAGDKQLFVTGGRYLSVRAGTNLSVRFLKNNSYLAELFTGANAGFFYDAGDDKSEWFDAVELISPAAQTVTVFASRARIGEASAVSVTSLPSVAGAFVHTSPAVIPVSQLLLAANAARKFLMVQNNDASAILYLNLNGGAAGVGLGSVKLLPGASLVLDVAVPNGAVYVYSDSVIAAGVLAVVEG